MRINFKIFLLIFCFGLISYSFAQLDIKRDDFVGTQNKYWWRWYDDGPSTPFPDVQDGYVLFSLIDPVNSYNPYCDAAIWDGYPYVGGPYMYCHITLRAKMLNAHKFGSRGFGLWYTEENPDVQQQIWFMQVLDSTGTGYTGLDWWRAETSYDLTYATHHYVDLDTGATAVDNEQWHVYEIIRDTTYIEMKVDGERVLYSEEDLPTQNLAFHIWVDNLVYEHVEPNIVNIHKREWIGKNDLILDYVEIITSDGQLDQSESADGIKLLRQVPNEIYKVDSTGLWKSYNFSSLGGNTIFLTTARVEQYLDTSSTEVSGDDDIRFVINGTDYGWNTDSSFSGDADGTEFSTMLFQQDMSAGTGTINIYAETSPLLYDFTVLGSPDGGIIYDNIFDETKLTASAELWKEITFSTWGGEVYFYISGTANEDPNPTYYGYQYSNFQDADDDELKIVIDGTDYGYKSDDSFWGNRLFGEPKSILVTQDLSQGEHTLRIYGTGSPTLNRVVIYGENDDTSLPVELKSFSATMQENGNLLHWEMASELNNLGFNLYRAESNTKNKTNLQFQQINDKIIPGAGTSSTIQKYSYLDEINSESIYFWYYLQDVSYDGVKTSHDTIMVERTEDFSVPQNYELQQNYPNPFNSSTVIKYQLPEDNFVTLEVYNALGQKVSSLVNTKQYAGSYNMKFDASELPSGIYYYMLKAGTFSQAYKMILIR